MTTMLRMTFSLLLILVAACASQSTSLFNRARALIEKNCETCEKPSRAELEEGIDLALKARDAGYKDRPAILRLLKDGYRTLAEVVLKPGDPKSEEAFRLSHQYMKELVEALPADANVRYESVHRISGNRESMMANIDERIVQYRQILVLDPNHEKARFDLANDLFRKGEDDEALQFLRDLVQSSSPDKAKVYSERLDSYLEQQANSVQVVSPIKFSGEVQRGKEFVRGFGPGLEFRLRPDEEGMIREWEIRITKKGTPYPEYSWVLTPPYHFRNGRRDLEPDTILSASNDPDTNGASFHFVRNRADYDRASRDVDVMLGHVHVAGEWEAAFQRASKDLVQIPYCVGTFKVKDSRVEPRTPDDIHPVAWMRFEVTLCSKERE